MIEPTSVLELWSALNSVLDHLGLEIDSRTCDVCSGIGLVRNSLYDLGSSCASCDGIGRRYLVSSTKRGFCGGAGAHVGTPHK